MQAFFFLPAHPKSPARSLTLIPLPHKSTARPASHLTSSLVLLVEHLQAGRQGRGVTDTLIIFPLVGHREKMGIHTVGCSSTTPSAFSIFNWVIFSFKDLF